MRCRLTEAKIRSLKTSKPQEDVFHTPTPSAGLRLTAEGRKTFFILYRSPTARDERGEPMLRRHSFGEHPTGKRGQGRYLSLKEFEREYDIFRGQLAQGIDPKAAPTLDPEAAPQRVPAEQLPEQLRRAFPNGYVSGTVGGLIADYLIHHGVQHLAPRSLSTYLQTACRHVLPRLQMVPAAELSPQTLREVLTAVTKQAPQSARACKMVLSVAYEWGVHHQALPTNPTREVKVSVPRRKRSRWLTDDELRQLLGALDHLPAKAADAYLLMLLTLCRPGEVCGVAAEDVIVMDGERVWRIPKHKSKTRNEHLIALLPPIAEILNRRCLEVGGRGPLFWRWSPSDSCPQIKPFNAKLRELTGLEDIRPHDLRRTVRTHLASLGVPREVAEACMNHVQGDVEGTYNLYSYWPERKEALARWHAKLLRLRAEARQQSAEAA